jgi:hypothetical protein
MNNEPNNTLDRNAAIEIEQTELETIAATLQVRSGLRAGRAIQPCI